MYTVHVGASSDAQNANRSQRFIRTVDNDLYLYSDTSSSGDHDYSEYEPDESPYAQIQTNRQDESEACPYEIPSTLAASTRA